MKVTFIKPNFADIRSSDAMQPLVFAILAGLTPPDIEIHFMDDRIEEISFDESTDLVALTVETHTAKRAYQIAARYRKAGIPVIMGGFHPTLMPDEVSTYADSVVIGDAEHVWNKVLSDVKAGRLQRIYRGDSASPLTGLKVDRRIFDHKRYSIMVPVQYGRGCRYACDFCCIHKFYGRSIRQRPINEVISEVEGIGKKWILFIDDNLFADGKEIKKFIEALIPLHIRWTCQISIDAAADTDLIKLMSKSGCKAVLVGFESFNEHNLKMMNKIQNLRHQNYAAVIQKFKDHGIMVYGTFLFGYDHDTVESFDMTVDFALKTKLCLANFNPLFPLPGTALYDRLKAEDRLIHEKWWLSPDYTYGQAHFHPRGMTALQLTEKCFEARQKFNTYRSILSRGVDLKANLRCPVNFFIYLSANLISRKEIYQKQGISLG